MVIALQTLLELVNQRKSRILLGAEMALPSSQYQAFRKFVLDEFGRNGLEKDLEKHYAESRRHGSERNGQE